MTINLGDKARDQVTGFTGIAVARTVWLHGCVRVTLQPQSLDKDGKPLESQTFDELQLALVKAGVVQATPEVKRAASTGGPRPEPVRGRDPR